MGLLGAIGAIGGSVLGGLIDQSNSRASAKQQYRYNRNLQEDNQAFQIEMAKNAHQYEIEDLKAAGLNPILSATGSSAGAIAGSSAPQGTSPGNNYDNFAKAIQNALLAKQTNSTKALNDSQIDLNNATATKTLEESDVIKPTAKAKIENLASATAVNKAEKEYKKSLIGLTQQQTQTEKENTTKTHNEAWESLHRSQKYDSERAKNYGTKEGQFGLMYEGRHKFVKPSNSAKYYKGKFTL